MNTKDEYFNWLFDLVCGRRYSEQISFRKLLTRLHDVRFRYSLPRDRNRADDGLDLRRRFDPYFDYDKPCSVLEMMVALAIRCEETIMDDPQFGDRTRQWFWSMITNLDLGDMTDDNYDEDWVNFVINRFLDREYEPDGRGGLFMIRNCPRDLRDLEIWQQLCWYLDTIT